MCKNHLSKNTSVQLMSSNKLEKAVAVPGSFREKVSTKSHFQRRPWAVGNELASGTHSP